MSRFFSGVFNVLFSRLRFINCSPEIFRYFELKSMRPFVGSVRSTRVVQSGHPTNEVGLGNISTTSGFRKPSVEWRNAKSADSSSPTCDNERSTRTVSGQDQDVNSRSRDRGSEELSTQDQVGDHYKLTWSAFQARDDLVTRSQASMFLNFICQCVQNSFLSKTNRVFCNVRRITGYYNRCSHHHYPTLSSLLLSSTGVVDIRGSVVLSWTFEREFVLKDFCDT